MSRIVLGKENQEVPLSCPSVGENREKSARMAVCRAGGSNKREGLPSCLASGKVEGAGAGDRRVC